MVTAYQIAGKTIEAYGAWDGEKIIPSPSYVFLDYDKPVVVNADIENINKQMSVSASGLFVFNEWTESRKKGGPMASIKKK